MIGSPDLQRTPKLLLSTARMRADTVANEDAEEDANEVALTKARVLILLLEGRQLPMTPFGVLLDVDGSTLLMRTRAMGGVITPARTRAVDPST